MQTQPVIDFGKQLVKQSLDDEVPDRAAGLAYRFLFAIFPFAIFLAALAGFIAPALGLGDPTNEILGSLSDNLPPDVAAQIRPQLEAVLGEARPGLLTIGALTALWAAAGGISSLINSMNKAYDVEETRNFFVKTGVALALTIVGSLGILVAFVTVVGGSIITEQVVDQMGITDSAWNTIALLRFPLVLALVAVAVAILFKFGPNVRVSFRWTLVGGMVFAVIWLLGTLAFGLYVANFANYANTYGALGGVVILMLWFYLTGLMMLVAAEVTSLLAKQHEPERIAARREELHLKQGGAPKVDERPSKEAKSPKPVVPTRAPELIPPTLASRPTVAVPTPRPKVPGPVAALAVGLGAVAGIVLGRLSGGGDGGASAG